MSISRNQAAVNSPRSYDSPKRTEQAQRTRHAVLSTAKRLFLSEGFAATTVPAIAGEAGVSVETVYKGFGNKSGLVRAICEAALAGAGPIPAEARSDDLQRRESDPRTVIRGWGRLAAEVAPRVQPILLLLRAAAATDAEMAALKAEIDDRRLARMAHNARTLLQGGHLAPGITAEYAADVMWTLSSAETYDMLVNGRGWPVDRYGTFVAETMMALLLP
jgi:AcrR family transcriptional regulator